MSKLLLDLEADKVWHAWMALEVSWEKFTKADVVAAGNYMNYDPWKLYTEVSILDWYRTVGTSSFPGIAALARVYLAKPMSNAYQERFFSTAGHVLSIKRTRLGSSRAEKLQLLMHASK